MLKSLLVSTIIALSLGLSHVNATILRVGFPGTTLTGVDYANFKAAHDAASAGDTIQIYQQYGSVGGGDITKRLTILGFGFMLDKNSTLQAIDNSDQNRFNLNFLIGSEGSVAQGLYLNTVGIITNDIKISRCRISNILQIKNDVSGVLINGCYFEGQLYSTNVVSNLYVVNNIFKSRIVLPSSSGFFTNNISLYTNSYYIDINSFLVKNNIFRATATPNGNIFENNLFGYNPSDIVGTENKFNVDLSTVFSNWNNGSISADNQLILKEGSPAIGAGKKNDGSVTDAGIFGGEAGDIYRLSGIPAVPAIYKLTAPSRSATTNPYTISVGVRSNN